jgi:nitrite reductase (NADH) small subunit
LVLRFNGTAFGLCYFFDMSDFVKIASTNELPAPGEAREFECGSQTICVANMNGIYAAVGNICPHRGGPLGQGIVEGTKIVCPWHGWEFDLATGNNAYTPNLSVSSYELKVEGGSAYARIREEQPASQD